MNVIDIGANVGVYSLPLARKVGKDGQVFAYEPGSKSRRHLESGRLENNLLNLNISGAALSDSEKDGWLQFADFAEANSLSSDAVPSKTGELVRVTTLDAEQNRQSWLAIDFVKIDAEGEEARIFEGGREFFSRHSPLVMFEVKEGTGRHNTALRTLFSSLGYTTYRLLGDASSLVPLGCEEPLDALELNLFAAKPDRAATLAEEGFCATDPQKFVLTEDEREKAIQHMLFQPYAREFDFSRDDILGCPFHEALTSYAAYRFIDLPPDRRYGALRTAFSILQKHHRNSPTLPLVATFVAVALDFGRRAAAREALKPIVTEILGHWHDAPLGVIDQPFFPPCRRYEDLPVSGNEAEWFAASLIEQLELSHSMSSCYSTDPLNRLQWLCNSRFTSAEMFRRIILNSERKRIVLPNLVGYIKESHCHANEMFWSETGLQRISQMLPRI